MLTSSALDSLVAAAIIRRSMETHVKVVGALNIAFGAMGIVRRA